jgi:quinol monooxygenase YgiN
MSILVILECTADPAHTKDLTDFLRNELVHTRGFDGCNSITIHTNQEDPNNFMFVENWDSKEQSEKYLEWRTERGDIAKLVGWMSGPPSIRHFDKAGV